MYVKIECSKWLDGCRTRLGDSECESIGGGEAWVIFFVLVGGLRVEATVFVV